MAFNVGTFKTKMTGDGARPNLFKVMLFGASGYFSADADQEFFIRATSIPGTTIGTVIVPYFGREVKFAGNRTFPDWTVTVINDETFKVRSSLEEWMDNINQHRLNSRKPASVTGYYGTALVSQLGKSGSSTTDLRMYQFNQIFPTDMSEITLDWGDNDSVEEFTVTFSYDYWEAFVGTATGSGGVSVGTG